MSVFVTFYAVHRGQEFFNGEEKFLPKEQEHEKKVCMKQQCLS
jgi:hypothetical protein